MLVNYGTAVFIGKGGRSRKRRIVLIVVSIKTTIKFMHRFKKAEGKGC